MRKQLWTRLSAAALAVLLAAALPADALAAAAPAENAPFVATAPAQPLAQATAASNVSYLDANGTQQTATNATEVTSGTTTWSNGWYVVNNTVTINNRVTVTGNVHLILADHAHLTVNGGIFVEKGNSLSIYAQSTGADMGKLTAESKQDNNAGIGGGQPQDAGSSSTQGGDITAIDGNDAADMEHAAKAATGKTLGTSRIANPKSPDQYFEWEGNYVYFGTHEGEPVKYRVLANETTDFSQGTGNKTMLLDCDSILVDTDPNNNIFASEPQFNESSTAENIWKESALKKYLNEEFFNKSFTLQEQDAIAESHKSRATKSDGRAFHSAGYGNVLVEKEAEFVPLTGEKIFPLDARELMNPTYGYFNTESAYENETYSPKKSWSGNQTPESFHYWTRTASYDHDLDYWNPDDSATHKIIRRVWVYQKDLKGNFSFTTQLLNNSGSSEGAASPAFNVNLSSVLFASQLVNTGTNTGNEYTLTLVDEKMTIQTNGEITRAGDTITVPYTIDGNNQSNAKKVSVLFLNKEYNANDTENTKVLGYATLNGDLTSGEGTLTLPPALLDKKCGKDYYAYLIAETENGEKKTDYASKPVKITIPDHPWKAAGNITINGGKITATGGPNAAGIGGGVKAVGGEVTISGGKVTATGGTDAAGIDHITTFSTGTSGHALIFVNGNIRGQSDQSGRDNWSGIIFEENAGNVYNDQTLQENLTILPDQTLTVPADTTLSVNADVTLTNNGTIDGEGILDGTGTLEGSGTVTETVINKLQKDSTVAVTVSQSPATYGSNVTITATVSSAANGFSTARAQNQVEFFVGTDSKQSLGTAAVNGDTATLSDVKISQEKGFTVGENTITAEYGGSMVLKPQTNTTQLTVQGDLTNATVTVNGTYSYTGSPITPDITVTWNGTTLTKDKDYTISYENTNGGKDNLTNAGTVTVTVTGTGNYIGTASTTFDIKKATPNPTTPTNLTAVYGSTLTDVSLPEKWAWDAPETSVGDVGDKTFPATYTKDNSGNYNEVKKDLTVTVTPAPYKLTLTGKADNPIQITLDEAGVEPDDTSTTVTYGYSTTNDAPDNWQTERVFPGLTSGTTYYFFAKAAATTNYAETVSQGVAITTPEKSVRGITITNQPANLSYTSGQTLNLNDLSVKVDYDDNTSETLTWDSGKLTAAPTQGTVLTVAEHNGKAITISYGGKEAETNVLTVGKAEQATLSITGAPDRIYSGSSFTLQTSGGSGSGAVTWSVVSGPATVDEKGAVKVTDIGDFQIKVVKAGDVNYNQAEATIKLTAVTRPSSGGGGGGGNSGGSTVTKPDGSTITTEKDPVTGTVTETTKRPDGSSTTVETQKDGTTTTTNKTPTGTTGTVTTDKNGNVTQAEGHLSNKDVEQSQKDDQPVKLPVTVPVTPEGEDAPNIEIDVPKDSGSVDVEIPVEKPTPGTVAVVVKPDGTKVPIKQSIVTENGVRLPLDGSAVIQIVDRSRYLQTSMG